MQFEEYVFPRRIFIFETYNPGAVVKLWAFTITKQWICLWENDGEIETISDPRVFAPPIEEIKIPTQIIRIEFNHQHLDYFTEIDGVLLEGIRYDDAERNKLQMTIDRPEKGPIQRKLEKVLFKTLPSNGDRQDQMLKDFLIKDLENFIAEINCGNACKSIVPDDCEQNRFTLKNMPSEILLKICSYLDLISLFRVSQTCRKLHQVACDPSLYTEINLNPYWDVVDSSVLNTFSRRCGYLKKVDLSWCGLFKNLSSSDFKE